jgi:hypothetical protein
VPSVTSVTGVGDDEDSWPFTSGVLNKYNFCVFTQRSGLQLQVQQSPRIAHP